MNQYFIAIIPPEDLQKEIRKIQLEVRDRFHSSKALNAPPHITLQMPFRRTVEEMEKFMVSLTEFCAAFNQFQIELRDFAHFENRTIYIDVVGNEHLMTLQSELCKFLLTQGFGENEVKQKFSPHISVARRDLDKRVFSEAWKYFSAIHFTRRFNVTELSVLVHQKDRWIVTKHLQFL